MTKMQSAMRWISAAVATCCVALPNAQATTTITTTTSYDCDITTGMLGKTLVEPEDSNLCLVTTIGRDNFGNIQSTVTRNCQGWAASVPGASSEAPAPTGAALFSNRVTVYVYGQGGRFPDTITNPLDQTGNQLFDVRFGGITSQQDPNGLAKTTTYDGLGRKTLETRPDGTRTQWAYVYCNNVQGDNGAIPVPTGAASASCSSVAVDPQVFYGRSTIPSYYIVSGRACHLACRPRRWAKVRRQGTLLAQYAVWQSRSFCG